MTEGFWGNYKTGVFFLIDEHEQWIRRGNNAGLLGIQPEIIAKISEYPTREDLLIFLFQNAPVMRWRGHGESVTFEFASESWSTPYRLIQQWGEEYAGPFLHLKIVNFYFREEKALLWKDFEYLQRRITR